jgi:hypothetical protein
MTQLKRLLRDWRWVHSRRDGIRTLLRRRILTRRRGRKSGWTLATGDLRCAAWWTLLISAHGWLLVQQHQDKSKLTRTCTSSSGTSLAPDEPCASPTCQTECVAPVPFLQHTDFSMCEAQLWQTDGQGACASRQSL